MLMYVHESIAFIERNDLCPNSLEIICAEIKKPQISHFFLVSSWDRPPNSGINIFNDYESFLQKCETNNCEFMLWEILTVMLLNLLPTIILVGYNFSRHFISA